MTGCRLKVPKVAYDLMRKIQNYTQNPNSKIDL